MRILTYNTSVPRVKGQEDRIVVQGTVAAMTMAGFGLIKGYRERKAALVIASLLLIIAIVAFLRNYYS